MYVLRRGEQWLPQPLNVPDGSMSLVGPDPLESSGSNARRFSVKPGVFGIGEMSDRQKRKPSSWTRLRAR